MAITHSQSEQARLASAAFARNLFKGAPLAFVQQALVDGGMSFAQAERFATDYAVLHQFDDLHGTGFSATVFEREGVKYLAIRGLEPLGLNFASGIDWVETGYEDIVKEGIAAVQGVALLNYIQRLCAPEDADDVVQYTYSPLTKAFGISSTAAKGLGVLTGTSPITVTGHSAGGHLAVIMSRLAPSLVSSVYTFNAPGFNSVTPGNLFPLLSDGFFAGLVGTGAVPVTGPIGGDVGRHAPNRSARVLRASHPRAAWSRSASLPRPTPGFRAPAIRNTRSHRAGPCPASGPSSGRRRAPGVGGAFAGPGRARLDALPRKF